MSEVSDIDGNCFTGGIAAADDHNPPDDVGRDEQDIKSFRWFGSAGSRSKKPEAKAPVDASADYYKMDHKKRGVCLILNYEKFAVPKLPDRKGTQVDRDNLITTFEGLGFEVITRDNLKRSETIEQVKKVAKRNHEDCDCFVMCVLSHGKEGAIEAIDHSFKHEEIFSPFTADNCPTLAGKPKLFFLQACQGKKLDDGMVMTAQLDSGTSYKIPIHADFLVAHSSIPGHYSWRHEVAGSWFVQALVSELQKSAEVRDILTLLTFVNRRVALNFESRHRDTSLCGKKQVPYITFMLTRLVQFSLKAPE